MKMQLIKTKNNELDFYLNLTLWVWIILLPIVVIFNMFALVQPYERAVKVTLGRINQKTINPGIAFKLPFVTSVKKYQVMTIREDFKTHTYTRDIQPAEIQYSISFSLNPERVTSVFQQYGSEWKDKIVYQNVVQVIKNKIGGYDAVELVNAREKVTLAILTDLRDIMDDYPVNITAFQILNIDYSDEFEKSIEAKMKAQVAADEAKNKTVQIREEAEQKLITARAEAESIRIQANALMANPQLVQWELAKRWDGKLPTTTGGSIPLLKLN
jgi:regulator of protease activity HflC (stomatin/prohibitin superfamily)